MKRFNYALQGMHVILKKDNKFWLHLISALIVVICGVWFDISRVDWLFIILAIGMVLAFEAINTALEYVVDLVTDDYHILAKNAKDVAAFSVMIASAVAFAIGLLVFLPYVF